MSNLLSKFGNFVTRAGNHVAGLQGDPMWNMGMGLLAAGGQRPGPKVSFGQGLLEATQFANQQVSQAQKLEAQRNALQQQKRQQNALNRATSIMGRGLLSPQQIAQGVQGQMGTGLNDAGMMDPQAQQNLLGGTQFWNNVQNNQQNMLPGLLAQANPGAFTQYAAQAQFAPPVSPPTSAKFADYVALGGDPNDMEAYQDFIRDPQDAMSARLLDLQTQNEEIDLENNQQEQRVAESKRRINTNEDLKSLMALHQANNVLRGTFAEPGRAMPAEREGLMKLFNEAKEFAGWDNSKEREILQAIDTFAKETERLQNNAAQRYGASTNMQFQSVGSIIPNIGTNPEVNDGLILSGIRSLLEGAVDLGIEVNDRDRYLNFLNAQSSLPPGAQINR